MEENSELKHKDLSTDAIVELQNLLQSIYNTKISNQEAIQYGQNLINIIKVIID